jgi:glycyl-tRNA synthetase beta chain
MTRVEMDRELLLEIGTEEIPASWLPSLTKQLGERLADALAANRLDADGIVETYSTPRRLTARIVRVAERQADLEQVITGPPVSAAVGRDGQPSQAAAGFARKYGVEVADLERVETPRGTYLAYRRRERGRTAVDVLPDVLMAVLRDLTCPKQMHWDAWLDDGRGELLFGRPIRWVVFLYGGRVVPFTIRRSELAESPLVQEVRSGAVTYGHRFLAMTGRPGRAIRVKTFDDYRSRLLENFVMIDRGARHDKIARELDAHAGRLDGRVSTTQAGLLQEVPDLVEYPSVVAGTFATEFLALPEEVLTTTMIHHQHFFPVASQDGHLMPAFLVVTNTPVDNTATISRNAERVLTARLRDAQFFFDTDRQTRLEARVPMLASILFHQRLGTYHAKALRVSRLAGWLVRDVLQVAASAGHAAKAGLLAKVDLTSHMVRELTELQGTMGGIYAREEGMDEEVWRAIYHHYLPVGVEADAPPTRQALGRAGVAWAGVALADKVDTVVSLFAAGERPTGTRDPFGLRRQAHGILKILVDLPDLTDAAVVVDLVAVLRRARQDLVELAEAEVRVSDDTETERADLEGFLLDRLRYLFQQRGFGYDEVNAIVGSSRGLLERPLDARRRLEALRAARGSQDFEALAVAFKRVKNLARELSGGPAETWDLLTEPAEVSLVAEYRTRGEVIRRAVAAGEYATAFKAAAGFRPVVDRFFNDVFVMVEEERLRHQRLTLVWRLHELLLELADISEIVPRNQQTS